MVKTALKRLDQYYSINTHRFASIPLLRWLRGNTAAATSIIPHRTIC
jgi:hypothetical protein